MPDQDLTNSWVDLYHIHLSCRWIIGFARLHRYKMRDRIYLEGSVFSVVTCNSDDADNAVICRPKMLESDERTTMTGARPFLQQKSSSSIQCLHPVYPLYQIRAVYRSAIPVPSTSGVWVLTAFTVALGQVNRSAFVPSLLH